METLSNRGQEMTLLLTGVDFEETVTIRDSDGAVVDLTDATFVAKIRRWPRSADALAEFEAEVVSAEDGTVSLSLDAATLQALTFDRAKWSLRMTQGGVTTQLFYGDVYLTPEPSQ